MKLTAKTKCLLALAAGNGLLIGCAAPLPELPEYTAPVLASLPALEEPVALADASNITQASNNHALSFVANDLVQGLSFISRIAPNLTAIKTPGDNTEFDQLVTDAMRVKGYSFDERFYRNGSEQLATSYLQKHKENDIYELTGIISVDSVLLKRVYKVQGKLIEPVSTYFIGGVNPEYVLVSSDVQFL